MLMVAAMFTNRPIYDSIRTCDVGLSQRGLCPVAKKPILEDRESDQSVAYFVSANFGLVPMSRHRRVMNWRAQALPLFAEQWTSRGKVGCRRHGPESDIGLASFWAAELRRCVIRHFRSVAVAHFASLLSTPRSTPASQSAHRDAAGPRASLRPGRTRHCCRPRR